MRQSQPDTRRAMGVGAADDVGLAMPTAGVHLLSAIGRDPATATRLSDDDSRRHYWRVPGAPSILLVDCRDYPESLGPTLMIGRMLAEWGVATPRIHALSTSEPVALMEDLGDAAFGRLLDQGADPAPLLEAATGVLAQMVDIPRQALPLSAPVYDTDRLATQATEAVITLARAVKAAASTTTAVPPSPRETDPHQTGRDQPGLNQPGLDKAGLFAAWRTLLEPVVSAGGVFVHGDFTLANLIDREEADDILGTAPVVIDVQDAGWGPMLLDLVCLLEDPCHTLPEVDVQTVAGMLPGCADLAPEDVQTHWSILTALRLSTVMASALTRGGAPAQTEALWSRWQGVMVEPELEPVRHWLTRALGPLPYPKPGPLPAAD